MWSSLQDLVPCPHCSGHVVYPTQCIIKTAPGAPATSLKKSSTQWLDFNLTLHTLIEPHLHEGRDFSSPEITGDAAFPTDVCTVEEFLTHLQKHNKIPKTKGFIVKHELEVLGQGQFKLLQPDGQVRLHDHDNTENKYWHYPAQFNLGFVNIGTVRPRHNVTIWAFVCRMTITPPPTPSLHSSGKSVEGTLVVTVYVLLDEQNACYSIGLHCSCNNPPWTLLLYKVHQNDTHASFSVHSNIIDNVNAITSVRFPTVRVLWGGSRCSNP